MTLSARLNVLIGTLLIIALLAMASLLFVRGVARIQAEEKAMLRATEMVVRAAVLRLKENQNPDREIASLLAQLKGLRHISVRPIYTGQTHRARDQENQDGVLNSIYTALVGDGIDHAHTRIDFQILGADVSAVELSPNPTDEILEIVGEISDIILISAIFFCLVFVISRQLVHHALKPILELQLAVTAMQKGDYEIAVLRDQSPEFFSMSVALSDLGEALKRAQEDSRTLAAKLVAAQDRERKEIARELHDELGACLFSIRAQAAALQSQLSDRLENSAPALSTFDTLTEQLETLQVAHHHVLRRLAPPGLQELGLTKALLGLIEQWRTQHPDKDIRANITLPDNLSELLTLTIYRIAQEGITNALRHANAKSISVDVTVDCVAKQGQLGPISVTIHDDGASDAGTIVPGFGLKSMEERVVAIGGTLNIQNHPTSGTCLAAILPVGEERPHTTSSFDPMSN